MNTTFKTLYRTLPTPLILTLSLCLSIAGCSNGELSLLSDLSDSSAQASCTEFHGFHDIAYSGSTTGAGKLHLAPITDDTADANGNTTHNNDQVKVALLLFQPDEKGLQEEIPMIEILGAGECKEGIVRARFGGEAGANAEYKILGGSFVGVFNPEVMQTQFGRWKMSVYDVAKKECHSMSGFWFDRAPTATSASVPKSKSSNSSKPESKPSNPVPHLNG